MSGQTLEVDSDAIRRAAEVIEKAAVGYGGSGQPDQSPLTGGCLGPSAAAQAVITAAALSLSRAQHATTGLAERSRTMAGALKTTASMFDVVDSLIGAGR